MSIDGDIFKNTCANDNVCGQQKVPCEIGRTQSRHVVPPYGTSRMPSNQKLELPLPYPSRIYTCDTSPLSYRQPLSVVLYSMQMSLLHFLRTPSMLLVGLVRLGRI